MSWRKMQKILEKKNTIMTWIRVRRRDLETGGAARGGGCSASPRGGAGCCDRVCVCVCVGRGHTQKLVRALRPPRLGGWRRLLPRGPLGPGYAPPGPATALLGGGGGGPPVLGSTILYWWSGREMAARARSSPQLGLACAGRQLRVAGFGLRRDSEARGLTQRRLSAPRVLDQPCRLPERRYREPESTGPGCVSAVRVGRCETDLENHSYCFGESSVFLC